MRVALSSSYKNYIYSCINRNKVPPVCSHNSNCKNSNAKNKVCRAWMPNASDKVVVGGGGCMHACMCWP